MIKIIVDSTCDLPEELMKQYDIKMLPLGVHIDGEDFRDKVTITVDEVYDAMRKGIIPKTSQPNPLEAYELFRDYAAKGYHFIFLSLSSKLSGTYQTVYTVIRELKEQFPAVNMGIVDSKGGSTATGLIALQIAKLSHIGHGFHSIVDIARDLSQHVEHIFTIADLSWLIKGGRISKAEGLIGNILNIKPIIQVNDGLIEVYKKVRGRKKALHTIIDIVEERMKEPSNQIIGISHADDLDTAYQLQEMIFERLGEKKTIINKIGSVLGTHLGIGGVGVFFFNKKPEVYVE